jgi:hypothetical protein
MQDGEEQVIRDAVEAFDLYTPAADARRDVGLIE